MASIYFKLFFSIFTFDDGDFFVGQAIECEVKARNEQNCHNLDENIWYLTQ